MSQPPPFGDWRVPGPPQPARRPLRGRRVAAGIGTALAGHALTALAVVVGLLTGNGAFAGDFGLIVMLIGQGVLFVGCLVVGIVLAVRQENGFGIGLLIGWAVGLIIAPVVGFGVCVVAFSRMGA